MREFETGAIRDDEDGKYDYGGALDPNVLHAFVGYMDSHRHMPDGNTRSASNWKHGFPAESYLTSLLRHVFDLWRLYESGTVVRPENSKKVTIDDALGGTFFNLQGLWRTVLQEREMPTQIVTVPGYLSEEEVRGLREAFTRAWTEKIEVKRDRH